MPRKFAAAFLIYLLVLIFNGCMSMSPAPPVEPASKPPPFHVWSYLRSYGEEPEDYATYSYVLAGRDGSDVSHTRRYNALVAAIKSSSPGADDMPTSVPKNLMNIFMIPAGKNDDTLNIGLSLSLVAALAASDVRFNNPGPFIVTVCHPVSFSIDPEILMLFVDLTNTHPDAMPEIVNVYKRRISQAPLQRIERLTSLKLALLNALLVANDRIGFATTAYANLKEVFVSE
jgi:hypothetical protein